MKVKMKVVSGILLISALLFFSSCDAKAGGGSKFKDTKEWPVMADFKVETQKDSVSFAIGFLIAMQSGQGLGSIPELKENLNTSLMMEAWQGTMYAILNGVESSEGDQAKYMKLSQSINTYITALMEKQRANNEAAETAFFEANMKKEGVKTTESGIQYKVLTEGKGAMPMEDQEVVCHYEGKLLNGKTFDSSYERGEPAAFGLTRVIPGWTEILQMMPVGSKWDVWIPGRLAYGERGDPRAGIGPNETLYFQIELIEVKEKPEEEGMGMEEMEGKPDGAKK